MRTSFGGVGGAAGRGVDRVGARTRAGIAHAGLVVDGVGNSGCHALAVVRLGDEFAFLRMAEVAEFEKQAGDLWVAGETKPTADKATMGGLDRGHPLHGALAADSEAVAVDTPVVGFGAADVGCAAVEMQTDQDGIAVAVGHADPVVEVEEGIVVAEEDGPEIPLKFTANALCHVEGQLFFLLLGVSADGARIFAAMTRIEEDGMESLWSGAMSPWVKSPGGTGWEAHRECGEADGVAVGHECLWQLILVLGR